MTWDAYNRRKTALHDVLAVADRHRELSADEVLDRVPGARAAFGTADDLLFDVQMYWASQLSGQMEILVGTGAETPEIGVISAWVNTAATTPGARALLDANIDNPALAKAFAKEDEIIARAAGVPAMSPDLLDHGRRIVDTARDQAVYPDITESVATDSPSIIARLRNALAA